MASQSIRGALLRRRPAAVQPCSRQSLGDSVHRFACVSTVSSIGNVASFSSNTRRPRRRSAQSGTTACCPTPAASTSSAASSHAGLAPRPHSFLAPWNQGQARWLSSTAPRSGDAISFSPSSTAELDTILEKIRTEVIVPSYLRAEQRRQIYSPRYAQQLRANPISLEIDGEAINFTHMDLFNDVPNARAAARDAIGRMTTPEDFENLPRLLEGLHGAGRHLRPADNARIARRAGERGCIYSVIECARTVRRTGYRLESSEPVAEILTHVQMKAVDSAWDEQATRQALTWTEMIVDLLEDENHGRRVRQIRVRAPSAAEEEQGESAARPKALTGAYISAAAQLPAPAYPLARDPQFLAARLHLAAVVADKFAEGDVDGKVAKYATDLMRLWPAGQGLRSLHPAVLYSDRHGEMYYLHEDNKFLGTAAPLLHGLDSAINVLGASGENADLVAQLKDRRDAVSAEVEAALAAAPSRRGASIYHKLFGGEAPSSSKATPEEPTE